MRLALALVLGVAGCGSSPAQLGPPDAWVADLGVRDGSAIDLSSQTPAVSATIRPSPDNTVTALVDVTAEHADSVVVSYGDTEQYERQTPPFPIAGGTATVTLLGLTPGAVSHARVTAYSSTGLYAETPDLTVATAPLPPGFPGLEVIYGGSTGYLLLSLLYFPDRAIYALVDRAGRYMWYREGKPTTAGNDFERLPNGHFAMYSPELAGYEEVDLSSQVVHTWLDPAAAYGADGHDFVYLPSRRMLLFGVGSDTFDSRPYFDGGVADAMLYDNTIDEVDLDGGAVRHFTSYPAIGPAEIVPDVVPQDPTKVVLLHPNALSLTPDGNLLASFRVTSSIMKIDRQTGAILWRLGGDRSDFTFVNDPFGGPSHQHDARFLPNGDLLLLDNGDNHPLQVSRVVEYRLDEQAKTATLVWEYRHDPDIYSYAAGSARRLPNGHTVVAWAISGIVTEVDAAGQLVWEMSAPWTIYRALPVPTLYP